MNFIHDGTDDVYYENIHKKILDGNTTKVPFVLYKIKFYDIDDEDTSFHFYHIISFFSTPYTLQEDLNIHGQLFFLVKLYM